MNITIDNNWQGSTTCTGPLAHDGRVKGKYLGTPFAGLATHCRTSIHVALDEPLAIGAGGYHCAFTGKEQLMIAVVSYEYDEIEARKPWGTTVTRISGRSGILRETYVEPEDQA